MSQSWRISLLLLLLLPPWAWGQALSRREASLLNPLEYGVTCSQTTLQAAISASSVPGDVLMLTPVDRDGTACTWTITTNLTVPSHVVVHVPQGVVVTINSGITLTLARYPREDNRSWKTGAGTLVITEAHPVTNTHNVKDFGAKGDGTTVDRVAILAAFAAASGAGGSKVIYFPSGTYFLGNTYGPTNDAWLDLSPYGDNLTIQTEKSVELLVHSPTLTYPFIPNMVYLRNNNHLRVGPIRLRDLGYDANIVWQGASGFTLAGLDGDNWGDVVFESVFGNQMVNPIEIHGSAHPSYRVRGVHIKELYSYDCFYGFTAQNQGDAVVIDHMLAWRNYRPYFVYGVTGHRVGLLHNLENRVTSAMVNIARLPGGLNTTDIEVNYVGRDMVASGTTPHVGIQHVDLLGGEISNIRLHIDIADASNSITGFPLRFSNYTGSGGVETTAPSANIVKDIYLSGSAKALDSAIWIEASYATKGRLSYRPGTNLVLIQGIYDKFALSVQQRGSTGVVWNTSGGTAPTLGNGTLTYDLDIVDGLMHVSMNLIFGSTTTQGTGAWEFSGFGNPLISGTAKAQTQGVWLAINAGVNFYTGACRVFATAAVVSCFVNANGSVGGGSPFSWGAGDSFHFTITIPLS